MIRRREFLAAGAAVAASATGLHAQKQRLPNILFVFADQLRAQSVGCYGNEEVRTPHLDRIASEGALFETTLANTPVCCPARANMLTGTYTHTNGMVANDLRLRESQTTVAEVLAAQDYRTGFIGKWHLDGGQRMPGFIPPGPRRQGFQFWAANECSHQHFNTQYFRDTPEPIPMRKFEAEGWTDLAIEFLNESKQDRRPFFLTMALGPPHDPYGAPEEYMRMFDPAKLTMRPNWRKDAPNVPGPKEIAAYYAATTAVDDQMGRLMARLKELGIDQDTIVLFSSDHGDMLGSQGRRLKRKPWEESIRIPGILRYPRGVKPGRRVAAPFTHVDFAPTLLSLCGMRPPASMQGSDLAPLALGRRARTPDSAFFQIFGPFQGDGTEDGWRGVRTENHMYARFRDKPWVLYDLKRDPYQMTNLAGEPAARGIQADMEKRLAQWMEQTGDSWSYNWSHLVEDRGRLYRHRTFYTVDEYMKWAAENPELDKK
ncbi:MAG: sulfatase [Bryobacterales bacterium]|nr:sulfatase [Bryobacterales bacterium]